MTDEKKVLLDPKITEVQRREVGLAIFHGVRLRGCKEVGMEPEKVLIENMTLLKPERQKKDIRIC